MTKLYNFAAVERLDPATKHRLHGRHNVFNSGWDPDRSRKELYKETNWNEAEFRCLHTCWLPRSSAETDVHARRNVTESMGWMNRARAAMGRWLGRAPESDYKMEKYRRGAHVTVDAAPFLT
jgi:hypothetical protein